MKRTFWLADMTPRTIPDRCRIVLVAPPFDDPDTFASKLADALSGGDVASVILPAFALDEAAFQRLAERLVPVAQAAGAAAVLAGEARIALRTGADGIHCEEGAEVIAGLVARHGAKVAVGAGGAKSRDDALKLGEAGPDYLFFGRFGFDLTPQPHARNLALGRWWAQMVSIPCIVQAGALVASARDVAATGADFVALSGAVFGEDADPALAVAEANALLDLHAPRFTDAAS